MKHMLTAVREGSRLYEHLQTLEEEGLLKEVIDFQVAGVRPQVTEKKQWRNNFDEDLNHLNLRKADVID